MKKTLSILLMLNLLGVPALAQVPADTRSAEQQAYDAETERIRAALAEVPAAQKAVDTRSAELNAYDAETARIRAELDSLFQREAARTAAQQQPGYSARERRRTTAAVFGLAGIITMIGGAAMFVPRGETYTVLDDPYCVDTYSVDAGSCSNSDSRNTAATIVLLTGAAMTIGGIAGFRANASKNGFSAGATVKW